MRASEEEEEEEVEEVEEEEEPVIQEKRGPTEAEIAMQKRREQMKAQQSGLDEHTKEMLDANQAERDEMDSEIRQMREKSERRRREREQEEKRRAKQLAEEDTRRRQEEEDRRRKKEEEEESRRRDRAQLIAEAEKWKNPPKPNFVIMKKASASSELTGGSTAGKETVTKSKEQLEAEKQAILAQRLPSLSIEGFSLDQLTEKAKELHNQLARLESEKYDLETRFKKGQRDMVELAEKARQMSKGGKGKGIKIEEGDVDPIQERFSGAPPKISLCSKYERRKDKRKYGERRHVFTGPQWRFPADRVTPTKKIIWGDNGPEYEEGVGEAHASEEVPAEVPAQ